MKEKKRNYGIDVLRMVSMFYIVILHSLGHGGVLEAVKIGSSQYMISWFLEIWAYCAVDVFALISGYFALSDAGISRRFENYAVLWCQVVFYSVLIVLGCKIILPDAVTKQDLLRAFFPVFNNNYWYFTAYTGLVCLMPVAVLGLRQLTQRQGKYLLVVLIMVFSVFDLFAKRLSLQNGYSFAWLLILFIIGAIVNKCGICKSWRNCHLVTGIVILNIVTWLWKIYGMNCSFLSVSFNNNLLVSYCSPTILVSSIFYLALFSRMPLCSQFLQKAVIVCGAGTFSVYLINDNPVFRRCFIEGRFVSLAGSSAGMIVVKTVLFALLFLISALLTDVIRRWLFRICRIRPAVQMVSAKIRGRLRILFSP